MITKTTSTVPMKTGCELCSSKVEDETSLTFASPEEISLWSKNMLQIVRSTSTVANLILCSECVFKINNVGMMLWQWKDRIAYSGNWKDGEEALELVKNEPSYDPASPNYDESREDFEGEGDEKRLNEAMNIPTTVQSQECTAIEDA